MASVAATIVSTLAIAAAGVSAYGSYQQGKSQEAIATFNAHQREVEAKQQLMALQTQAALQKQQTDANFLLRSAEAEARLNNADAIDQQALAQDAIDRENMRKRRTEFERMQGAQRATIAASGVAEATGTPLDLLAETAAKIQQDREEQQYAHEVRRRTLFHEGSLERLGGHLALTGATLERDSALAEAALYGASGQAQYQAGLHEAEIGRLTGQAARQAANYQTAATIFSGLSSAAGTAYDAKLFSGKGKKATSTTSSGVAPVARV